MESHIIVACHSHCQRSTPNVERFINSLGVCPSFTSLSSTCGELFMSRRLSHDLTLDIVTIVNC